MRKEHPLNKDSKQQQVNDDDVRDYSWLEMQELKYWILESESMLEAYEKCMKWADPNDLRTMSIFHFGTFLVNQQFEDFKKFRWPFDWWGNSTNQNFLIDLISQELVALLHEIPDNDR